MTRTNTSVKQLAALGNEASPHHMEKLDDQPQPVPYFDCDVIAPAGSINSCATDLVNWLKLQMGDGKYEGKQLISAAALNETHTPQTIVSGALVLNHFPEAEIRYSAYCLGWGTYGYRQHRVVTHTGGIDGMRASLTMLPDDHVGLAVLTNSDYGDGCPQEIIKNCIVDHFLHLPNVDWNQKLRSLQAANEAKDSKEEARIARERVSGTKPSHPLKDYVGTFENDLYGQLKIELHDDKLVFSWPRDSAATEHWHFDTFKLTFGNKVLGTSFATFNQLVDGTIDSVEFPEFGSFKRR